MILDLGCGDGRRWNITDDYVLGIDVNAPRLKHAKSRISVAQCDGRFLPFRSSIFSLVMTDSVLEHVDDYRRVLLEIRRVLVSGGTYRIMQPVDNDPIFIIARRVARSWRGDKIYSYFTARQLLRSLSACFDLKSVDYLPNAPIAGLFGFFNRKTPQMLHELDNLYGRVCKKTAIFHWKAIIEATKNASP